MTPTERTLAELRARGVFVRKSKTEGLVIGPDGVCEVVERWVPMPPPGHRKDLFGFCDLLVVLPVIACDPCDGSGWNNGRCERCDGRGGTGALTLAIQACAAGSAGTRLAKLDAEPRVRVCLDAGWAVEVWAWKPPSGRGASRKPERLRRIPLAGQLAALPEHLDGAT